MTSDTRLPQESPAKAPVEDLGSSALRWFLILAFALGWGLGILMTIFSEQVESVFGEISGTNPVFILVVYSPAIAAVSLILRRHGAAALGPFFRRLTLWRMPSAWWWFLLIGIPAIKYVGAAFNGTAGDFPFTPWYDVLLALLITAVIGPMEEFGWRGLALPLLQRRHAPLWAALILGGFWGLWHLPAFLLSGTPQSAWSFGPFIIGVLALSVLVTPMFNASGGSILIPMLFHYQMNGPAWPEAQPWENYLFAIAALIVVIINRHTMLSKEGAVTNVLVATDGEVSRATG